MDYWSLECWNVGISARMEKIARAKDGKSRKKREKSYSFILEQDGLMG